MKKLFSALLKVTFIGSAFTLIFRPQTFGFPADFFEGVTPTSLLNVLQEVDTQKATLWLGFALAVKLGGILAGVLRWRLLLRGQNIQLPLWYLAKCWFMGRAVGLFLPGTLGLDAYRLVESARETGQVIRCAAVIVIEKLIGFIALATLVFLTLPLGLRFLEFDLRLLAVLLTGLALFIGAAMFALMTPRIIPWFIERVPTPAFLSSFLRKLSSALTAYTGQRALLLKATGLGLCVHLGICFMYFGTASAVHASNTSLLDILFASPLIIVGSVLSPTVSGAGVREVVFGYFFTAKAGAAAAITSGHLGLWTGEIIPFLLSMPLLLLAGRPNREEFAKEMASVQAELDRENGGEEPSPTPQRSAS